MPYILVWPELGAPVHPKPIAGKLRALELSPPPTTTTTTTMTTVPSSFSVRRRLRQTANELRSCARARVTGAEFASTQLFAFRLSLVDLTHLRDAAMAHRKIAYSDSCSN